MSVSGPVRTVGGVGIRSALMRHQYLCPRLCFLSLGCRPLPSVDSVSLDYVIGLCSKGPRPPLLFSHNALDVSLKGPAEAASMALMPATGAVVTRSCDPRRAATSEPRVPVSVLMSQIDHMVVLFFNSVFV